MSAIVCGKRSFFDELQAPSPTSASPPVSKKLRCSPGHFSPPSPQPQAPSVLDQLQEHFPFMDTQFLKNVEEECGSDLDAAIKRMCELCLGYAEQKNGTPMEENSAGIASISGKDIPANGAVPPEDPSAQENIPINGADWVDLIVTEMKIATSIDDARSRAARILQNLEKSIRSCAVAEAAQSFQKEHMILKEHLEVVLRENCILKRAVAIQHERQKEYDDRVHEVQQLKHLVTQYQEKLRTLEVNNYALSMHLRQARHSNSFTGHFPPDIC